MMKEKTSVEWLKSQGYEVTEHLNDYGLIYRFQDGDYRAYNFIYIDFAHMEHLQWVKKWHYDFLEKAAKHYEF